MAAPLVAPQPLPPNVQRFTPDGKPTKAMVEYEAKLLAFLRAVAAKLPLT